jgi:hypothetical protein
MQFEANEEDCSQEGGFFSIISNGSLHVITKSRKYYRATLDPEQVEQKRDQEEELIMNMM